MGEVMPVRLFGAFGNRNDLHLVTHPKQCVTKNVRIFLRRNDTVAFGDDVQQRDFGIRDLFGVIDGLAAKVFRLLFAEAVGGQALFPGGFAPDSRSDTLGPAAKIANGRVAIDASNARRVLGGPVVDKEPTSADSLQSRFGVESALAGHHSIKLVTDLNRLGTSEKAGHVDVPEMESFLDELHVHLGMVTRKAGTPDPRIPLQRLFGHDQVGVASLDREMELIKSMPLRFALVPICLRRARFLSLAVDGEKENKERQEQRTCDHRKPTSA